MKRKPLRRRLAELSSLDLLIIGLPTLLIIVGAFWLTARFVQPAPPNHITMSTGGPGGAYQVFAARYKPILAREGIELRERPSAGAVENLQRLENPAEDVDVAFVQGGLAVGTDAEGLVSLGSFYYEPVWVFYRGATVLNRLIQLRGKRIAVGGEGSGTRKLALDLLDASGVTAENATLLPVGGLEAVEALSSGAVDAVIAVGPSQSATVWSLLFAEGVRLMSLEHADAYTRRFPYLAKLTLPEGAIDIVRQIPPRDTVLVAPMATLVARDSVHPALIDLLLSASRDVHGKPGLFQRAGEFPNAVQVDFPLSKEADRFHRSGSRFLHRYMPFWAATLVDRLIVFMLPLFAVLFPLMRVAPFLYTWRVRSRVYRWYGELKFLEAEVEESAGSGSGKIDDWLARLDRLETEVEHVRTPLAFAHQLYILREHIGLVREAVMKKAGATHPAG